MKTKVIALDIYGTCLPTKGGNTPRKGLEKFLGTCKDKGLILCTSSDGKTANVKEDLSDAGVDLGYFDNYFEMPRQKGDFTKQPKNFKPILDHYELLPEELTVIGDRQERDITPAIKLGCNAILVPEYKTPEDRNSFDINEIKRYIK